MGTHSPNNVLELLKQSKVGDEICVDWGWINTRTPVGMTVLARVRYRDLMEAV